MMRDASTHEEFIAAGRKSFESILSVDRTYDIEQDRVGNYLTPAGFGLFVHSVRGYLLGCRTEADELRDKAYRFLLLAHQIQERPKARFTGSYAEGIRCAALSYVQWLATGAMDVNLLTIAADRLKQHFLRSHTVDQASLEMDTPLLLYTGSYPLIGRIAKRFSLMPTSDTGRKRAGLFFGALRVALAAGEMERQELIDSLKTSTRKRLFGWIEKGYYDSLAFALYALFHRPDGEPCRLIETAWDYIP